MTTRLKNILKLAKGFRGRAKNCIRIARPKVEKALKYAYRDRKVKKRIFRSNWIVQVNGALHQHGLKYSNFARGLVLCDIALNRKMLAEIAVNEPYSFYSLQKYVKETAPIKFIDPYRKKMSIEREINDPPSYKPAWNEKYYQEKFFADARIRSARKNKLEEEEIKKKKIRLEQLQIRFEQKKKEVKQELEQMKYATGG
eukprot:TRINITY_DN3747_c0_g1_i1.p1 TRINITY_DN3747_c0_g1~~TRINITY_DN3747_c0_g1_i1.p1  ORF type:complete len:199 (-),score=33.86 TRINITY_DN3747_c0_g1_i1:28-624(-)